MSEPAATIGPYRVLRRLGSGGMGEVFLAWDPRLEREVAIKRIRSGTGEDPDRQERFRREARVTAGLNHPAIVQVFDVITEGDADHLVMEYVPGESLRQMLAASPLPLPQGLAIAADIAEGLAYAHRRGVLHRDLKTENVLVTPEGQAKIADFGIALRFAAEGDPRLTREGLIVGTYRVMSPEQACGDQVEAGSDLFSLGVLLYELFAGTSPFLAPTGRETLQRILDHWPPPLLELSPDLPPELSRLVEELLEKDPALRPADARRVAERLRALATDTQEQEQETILPTVPSTPRRHSTSARSTTRPAEPAPPPPPKRRLWIAWLGGAAALFLVMIALALRFRTDSPAAPEARPLYVAVLQPDLRSGQPSEATDFLAFAARGALQSALTRFEGVFSKATSEVDAVSGSPAAVARAVAADEILEPSFACQAQTCSVEVGRLRASDGSVTWSGRVDVPLDDPLTAARALGVLIRQAYPERRLRPGVPDLRVSPEAYAEYLAVRRQLSTGGPGANDPALARRLAEIRRRSPEFVDPYLVEAQLGINRFELTRDKEQLDRALALLEDARALAPGDPEVHYTQVYAQLRGGRLDEAEETLASFELQAPGDVRVLDLRADLLERQGQPAKALALARDAAGRQPSWVRLYTHARLAWRQGEIAAARESLESLLERSPGNSFGRTLLANIELTNGDPARAAALYQEIAAAQPADSGTLGNLGLARMLQGDYDGSAEALERAVAAEPQSYFLLLNLGQARWLQGRRAQAQEMFRRVLSLSEKDPAAEEWQRLTVRAQAFAHLGERRRAVTEAQEALRLAPLSGQVAFEASLVFALVGDRTAALVNADRARELGFEAPGWFRLPWFEPLLTDPDFREFLHRDADPAGGAGRRLDDGGVEPDAP
ncbi:MAG TPA: protein kinase [Thermoanaerobaculia bacterium]|jgi:serine/threonine-protein kinase|nr:protein kinase [Thermoanaerobaculia bacterium]